MRKRIELIAEIAEGVLTVAWGCGLISMSVWFWATVPLGSFFFINLAVGAYLKSLAFLYGLLIIVFIVIGLVMLVPR